MSDLEQMVERLRKGDRKQVNPICLALLPAIMKIAKSFGKEDEWVSAACLTLVECVNRADKELEDNNIEPYVTSRVRWRLRDAYREQKNWCLPARTGRQRKSEGQRIPLEDYVAPAKTLSLDFKELIQSIVKSDVESVYIEMRSARYSLEEIANHMKVSLSTVQRTRALLKSKYAAAS